MLKNALFFLLSCASLGLKAQTMLHPDSLAQARMFFSIEQASQSPDKVYKLFADEMHYTPNEVFETIKTLPNLQSVHLVGALFMELPKEILALGKQLQELVISDNEYIIWPKVVTQIQDLPRLRHLRSEFLPGQMVPEEICQLSRLERLSITSGTIDSLPDCICGLKNLKILDLRSSGINRLPQNLGQLKNLESLYLGPYGDEGWPLSLKELPASIGNCRKLKHLDLKQAGIRSLPPSLKNCKNLEWLDLSGNRVDKDVLPLVVELRKLRHLNLADTGLKTLPKNFGQLEQLEFLALSYCPLLTAPLFKLPRLQSLQIYGTDLPEEQIERTKKQYQTAKIGHD